MNDNRKADLYATDLSTAVWRKSSVSAGEGQCVEIANVSAGGVAIRDSKDPNREPLRFDGAGWAAFRASVVAGEL